MGTTLTAAKVEGDEVSLGHVGDSRAYLLPRRPARAADPRPLAGGRARAHGPDHRRGGREPSRSARSSRARSGPEPDVEVDTYTVTGRDGDIFLICSDGLTGMVGGRGARRLLRAPTRSRRRPRRSCARRTRAAAGTTSPSCCSASATTAWRRGARRGRRGRRRRRRDTIAGTMSAEDVRRPPPGRGGPSQDAAPTPRAAPRGRRSRGAPDSTARAAGAARARAAAGRRRGRARARRSWCSCVLAGVVAGLYALSRQVYFVATNDGGLVTVYRGIPYELPFGINLYKQEYASGVPARAIPPRAGAPCSTTRGAAARTPWTSCARWSVGSWTRDGS